MFVENAGPIGTMDAGMEQVTTASVLSVKTSNY